MSASLVTFANLGKKKNLKTSDVTPIIEALASAGELEQVICQINEEYQFRNTISAFPSVVRYGIGALRRIPGLSLSRQAVERIFDLFAAHRLVHADVTLLHGAYFLPRTSRSAHESGSMTVDMAVSAHLKKNAELEKEELTRLGFPAYEGLYTRLARTYQPAECDYVIAMSDFAKESYVQEGFPADRIYVAQPDIEMARFTSASRVEQEDRPFRVLYIAHTQPLKGLHYLFEAWQAFTEPATELVIIGGFSDMPMELKRRYASSIHKDSRITWIPSTAVPEDHYRKASVFVFPSLSEGFGRVTLEAMACGVPVVTTENARGMVEDGKTGFVVPIRDAKALLDKITFLYHNSKERKEMGTAARSAAQQKKSFGTEVLNMYQDIMKVKKRQSA